MKSTFLQGAVALGGGGFEPARGPFDRFGVGTEIAVEQMGVVAAFELAADVGSIHRGNLRAPASRPAPRWHSPCAAAGLRG